MPPERARVGFLLALVAAAGTVAVRAWVAPAPAAAAEPATAADPATPAPEAVLASALHPAVGGGDFEFYVDAAAMAPADNGLVRTRLLLQFPLREFLEQTGENSAELHLLALAYEAGGALAALQSKSPAPASDPEAPRQEAERSDRAVHELLEDFGGITPQARAEAISRLEAPALQQLRATDYQLAEIYLDLAPGEHVLEVQVENLSRLKKGLLDKLRKRHLTGTARLLLQVPDFGARPALSDPVFLAGHGKLQHYAARVYGLLNDSLHVRSVLWTDAPARIDIVAHDRDGAVHWRDSLLVQQAGRQELHFGASIQTLPAGQYVLTLTAQTAAAQVTTRRSFDVAWSLSSWRKSRRDLEFEAETILTEEEFRAYDSLPLGEKERYLDAFWQRHDPTPDTALNELQAEFQRRVAFADAQFSETVRGARTHRGKVYIRFGPPNEVQAEAVPSHLAGEGAEDLVAKVDDPYTPASEEVLGVPAPTQSRDFRSSAEQAQLKSEARRVVGPARELISYELWVYLGHGQPLMPRDVVGIDAGFRLLFMDTQGFGQFLLRKSSVTLDIPGLHSTY